MVWGQADRHLVHSSTHNVRLSLLKTGNAIINSAPDRSRPKVAFGRYGAAGDRQISPGFTNCLSLAAAGWWHRHGLMTSAVGVRPQPLRWQHVNTPRYWPAKLRSTPASALTSARGGLWSPGSVMPCLFQPLVPAGKKLGKLHRAGRVATLQIFQHPFIIWSGMRSAYCWWANPL